MSRAIGGLNEIFIYGRSLLREVGRGNDRILPRSEATSAIKIHGPEKGPSTVWVTKWLTGNVRPVLSQAKRASECDSLRLIIGSQRPSGLFPARAGIV
jgi:hypothetical protein